MSQKNTIIPYDQNARRFAVAPPLDTSRAITGQVTVETAGTAVQGPDVALENGVIIKALSGNSGLGYVGNDGDDDVTSGNGFELSAGDQVPVMVSNLNELYFDVASNGDKFCWLRA